MKNVVGNEVNFFGTTQLEVDYARGAWFRSFARAVAKAVLCVVAILALMAFFVALSAAIHG